MNLLRSLMVVGMVLVLTAPATSADKAKKKGGVAGTIVSVTPDEKDKDSGTIKVKVAGKKDAAGEEKTFKYTKDTKYWKSEGKNNEVAAVLADLVKDTRVMISTAGDPPVAEKITIVAGKKK